MGTLATGPHAPGHTHAQRGLLLLNEEFSILTASCAQHCSTGTFGAQRGLPALGLSCTRYYADPSAQRGPPNAQRGLREVVSAPTWLPFFPANLVSMIPAPRHAHMAGGIKCSQPTTRQSGLSTLLASVQCIRQEQGLHDNPFQTSLGPPAHCSSSPVQLAAVCCCPALLWQCRYVVQLQALGQVRSSVTPRHWFSELNHSTLGTCGSSTVCRCRHTHDREQGVCTA